MKKISNKRIIDALDYAMVLVQAQVFAEGITEKDMDKACESLQVLACLKFSLTAEPVNTGKKAA